MARSAKRRARPASNAAENVPLDRDPATGVAVARYGNDRGTKERMQHGDVIVLEETMTAGVSRRRVETQTMLDRYAARGLIADRHHTAGTRLYRDWFLAGRSTPVTMAYRPPVPRGSECPDPSQVALGAGHRFRDAMAAVGPVLAPIVVHVCLLDQAAGDWAKAKGSHPNSAIPILQLALDALVAFPLDKLTEL